MVPRDVGRQQSPGQLHDPYSNCFGASSHARLYCVPRYQDCISWLREIFSQKYYMIQLESVRSWQIDTLSQVFWNRYRSTLVNPLLKINLFIRITVNSLNTCHFLKISGSASTGSTYKLSSVNGQMQAIMLWCKNLSPVFPPTSSWFKNDMKT